MFSSRRSRAEEVGHLFVGSSVAQQQPRAASPSTHSSDFNNAPLAMTSPQVTPSNSPKYLASQRSIDRQDQRTCLWFFFFFLNSYLNLKSSLFSESQVIKTDTRSSSVSWRRISNQPSCQTRLFLSTVPPYHLLSLSMLITFRAELSKQHFRRCCAFTK